MAMATFWKLGAMSWCIAVISWLAMPIISFIVNKLFSYLAFDTSTKLRELELHTIPSLKLTLKDVLEQIVLREAKYENKGYECDLITLRELAKDLKSALYEAEDILDLIKYHRTKKKVNGNEKSAASVGSSWVHAAIGTCIDYCKGWWVQASRIDGGSAVQLAAAYEASAGGATELRIDIEQGSTTMQTQTPRTASNPPTPNATSNSASSITELRGDHEQAAQQGTTPDAPSNTAGSTTESRGGNEQGSAPRAATTDVPLIFLVQMIRDWLRHLSISSYYRPILSWPTLVISTLRPYRDWSYEVLGIQNNDDTAAPYALSKIDRSILRKKIVEIEHILHVSKQSHLLNQQINSIEIPVNDSNKASSSLQEDIDDWHRRIEHKVFGRDKERDDICRMLRKGLDTCGSSSSTNKPYSVVGIHGIAGSGKSTLAQYVCDYEKAEGKHFDLIMFVHVSKTFRLHYIIGDMLKEIIRNQDQKSDCKGRQCPNQSLHENLKEKLQGRRFLLVLDDLWANDENQDERDILLNALCAGKSGSRILVTSQTKDAAAALGAQEQISIPDLEENEYLSLFMHHALQGAVDDDGKYERIGRKIVQRLHRSPIAAITVARRLQTNISTDFWETTAKLGVLSKTMGALWWSYQQLGPDIRPCFVYCSIFPRGYEFEREDLVGMWIAQGFVKSSTETEDALDNLGQSYLDQLLAFSFLQVRRIGLYDEKIVFIIHDLLHELAERAAVWDFFRIDVKGMPINIPPDVRHLFVETNNREEITEKILDLEHLRTLIISEKYGSNEVTTCTPLSTDNESHNLVDEKIIKSILKKLKKLRVLIVTVKYDDNLGLDPDPASFDEMQYIRYLSFRSRTSLQLSFPSTHSERYRQMIDSFERTFPGPVDMPDMPCISVQEEEGKWNQLEELNNNLRGFLKIDGLGLLSSREEALQARLDLKTGLTKLVLDFGDKHICSPELEVEVLDGLCPAGSLEMLTICGYKGSRYPSWTLSSQHPCHPKYLNLNNCTLSPSLEPLGFNRHGELEPIDDTPKLDLPEFYGGKLESSDTPKVEWTVFYGYKSRCFRFCRYQG